VQGFVAELASACGGSPLMLMLVAGAVRLDADDHGNEVPGAREWKGALTDLHRCLHEKNLHNYTAPLKAYALSVERLPASAKSLLSTLCLFPAVRRAPVEMVRSIWQSAPQDPCALGVDISSALRTLKRANIVDLHWEDASSDREGVAQTFVVVPQSCLLPG
jgi:hypothetical protein